MQVSQDPPMLAAEDERRVMSTPMNGLPALSPQILELLAFTLDDITIHQNSHVLDELAAHADGPLQDLEDRR